MIKFFRRIRRELLSQNPPAGIGRAGKTRTYLKYALGEIVLVMIGILLALQLNIWNENRKVRNEIESVFTLLEEELETNIRESNDFLRYGYHKDSIRTLFDKDLVTPEMFRKTPELARRDFGTRTTRFFDDRLVEIIAAEKQLPEPYKELIPEIKILKNRIDEHKFWESRALDLAYKKQQELVNKFSWFYRRDSLSIERHIQHALTDTIYRNNVNYYNSLQLNENVWYASLLRTSSVALLWNIKQIKGMDKNLTIKEFLNNLDLQPLSEYACSDKPYPISEIYFRRSFVIYNNTNKSTTFNYIDQYGTRGLTFTILPNKFMVKDRHSMGSKSFIELVVEEE